MSGEGNEILEDADDEGGERCVDGVCLVFELVRDRTDRPALVDERIGTLLHLDEATGVGPEPAFLPVRSTVRHDDSATVPSG
jgi:hypothetical protein